MPSFGLCFCCFFLLSFYMVERLATLVKNKVFLNKKRAEGLRGLLTLYFFEEPSQLFYFMKKS